MNDQRETGGGRFRFADSTTTATRPAVNTDDSRRLPALLLAGCALLLALLAALQYSSTSRLIRSTQILQTNALRISMEHVRASVDALFEEAIAHMEIDAAPPTAEAGPSSGPATALAARVTDWNRIHRGGAVATAWLIDSRASAPGVVSALNDESGRFAPVPVESIPDAVRAMFEDLPAQVSVLDNGAVRFRQPRSWYLHGGGLLILPVVGLGQPGDDVPLAGFAVLSFDREFLIEHWIPSRLADAAESFPEFDLSVVESVSEAWTDASAPPDVVVPLVSGTSRTYEFVQPGRASLPNGQADVAVTAGVTLESIPEIDAGVDPSTIDGPGLVARHRTGSLDAAWRSAMFRQFGLTLVIVAVIGCSIALLVLTARRSRRLADRHSAFAAGMSHELRTPVSAIGALADNLQSGLVTGEKNVREYGDLIQRERRRLHDMLEGVLAWAASRSGQGGPREPLDAGKLLEDEVHRFRDTRHADVRLQMDESLVVAGHEGGLRLVIRNIVGNALKHGPAEGPVRIEAARVREGGQSRARIRISDSGPGIPESERNLVFDAFYRGRRARSSQVAGSGLGLDLVRMIVEEHDGRVRIESSPDGGACVVIDLPLAEDPT